VRTNFRILKDKITYYIVFAPSVSSFKRCLLSCMFNTNIVSFLYFSVCTVCLFVLLFVFYSCFLSSFLYFSLRYVFVYFYVYFRQYKLPSGHSISRTFVEFE